MITRLARVRIAALAACIAASTTYPARGAVAEPADARASRAAQTAPRSWMRRRRAPRPACPICRASGNRTPIPTASRGGIEGIIAPRYMIDMTRDVPQRDHADDASRRRDPPGAGRQQPSRQPGDSLPATRRAAARLVHAPVQDRANAGAGARPLRIADAVPPDLHRRPAPARGSAAGLARLLGGPVGRRHPGRADRGLHRPDVARRQRPPAQRGDAPHRAVHQAGRRNARHRGDDRRSRVRTRDRSPTRSGSRCRSTASSSSTSATRTTRRTCRRCGRSPSDESSGGYRVVRQRSQSWRRRSSRPANPACAFSGARSATPENLGYDG